MSDRDRGLALLAEVDDQQRRLARAVCLAIFVEPGLLRRARRNLVPDADFGAERDLWFGPLVQTRNPTGILLEPDALAVLREEIADGTASPRFAAEARRLVQAAHAAYPPALQLEEDILWESTRNDPGAPARIESRLREAVKTMVTTAPPRAREVARWAAQAWGRLPEMARETEAARQLAVGSSLRIGTVVGPAAPGAGGTGGAARLPGDLGWLSPPDLDTAPVGIVVHTDGVRFVPPEGDVSVVRPPRTSPPVLEVAWRRGTTAESRVVAALAGTTVPLPAGCQDLTLRTLDGRRYELRAGTGAGTATVRRRRLVVLHAAIDLRWAEWAAWQLEAAGYQVVPDRTGSDATLVLLSQAYLENPERVLDPKMIILRIEDVRPPNRTGIAGDLFELTAAEARRALLGVVARRLSAGAETPAGPPPTSAEPRFPGTRPSIWNVPARNPGFTGRTELLQTLRDNLSSQHTAATAVLGIGGIGKTELVLEYAYRFAGDYDIVWWIAAENPSVIGGQMARLAVQAEWAPADVDLSAAVEVVRERLRGKSRWFLVFDNAESPSAIQEWLPTGPGHVLITSRSYELSGVAETTEIGVFNRAESVEFIRRGLQRVDGADADRLANVLGDLPLALDHAVAFLAETGLSIDDYLDELERNAAELLSEGMSRGYSTSLAAGLAISLERLAGDDRAAVQLLEVCAVLAPMPVPIDLFSGAAAELSEPLATVAASASALYHSMTLIDHFGLARTEPEGLQVHRLVGAVIRDRLGERELRAVRDEAEALLLTAEPPDPADPAYWPRWASLLPHLLAVDPATTENRPLRSMACDAVRYLLNRGDARTARQLAEGFRDSWSRLLGPDHNDVLVVTSLLSNAASALGLYEEARQLSGDVLDRQRRLLGDDHPNTLATAQNLAVSLRDLGLYQEARELAEDTYERLRRVLGDDHRNTLYSANNLAYSLNVLGEYQQARELDEETLNRQRRLLGDDHPDTLSSASNLADDLASLGDLEQAVRLRQDTLAQFRRVLGDDHPSTLREMAALARDLSEMGRFEEARALLQDVVARSSRVLGDDHPETRSAVRALSQLNA